MSIVCDVCSQPAEELLQRVDWPGVTRNGRVFAPLVCNQCAPFPPEETDMCKYFLKCTNQAVVSVKHPIMGAVRCCARCTKFSELPVIP